MKLLPLLSVVLLSPFASPGAAASTVSWDTTPSWVGTGGIEIFGDTAYAYPACGQSFTAPADINAMESFTFFLLKPPAQRVMGGRGRDFAGCSASVWWRLPGRERTERAC